MVYYVIKCILFGIQYPLILWQCWILPKVFAPGPQQGGPSQLCYQETAKNHSSLSVGGCQAQILQTPIFCLIQTPIFCLIHDQLNCYVSTEQSNQHTKILTNQTLVKCFSFLQVSGFWAILGLWQHACPQAPPRMVGVGAKHSLV